jgi:hypothetical protein
VPMGKLANSMRAMKMEKCQFYEVKNSTLAAVPRGLVIAPKLMLHSEDERHLVLVYSGFTLLYLNEPDKGALTLREELEEEVEQGLIWMNIFVYSTKEAVKMVLLDCLNYYFDFTVASFDPINLPGEVEVLETKICEDLMVRQEVRPPGHLVPLALARNRLFLTS